MDLERQFRDFLAHVPYKGNEATYSYRLLNLILGIGGYVDSSFKEMARYSEFSEREGCKEILAKLSQSRKRLEEGKAPITISIKVALKTFESIYHLSEKHVIFRLSPEREKLLPFKPHNPKTKAPYWWETYNGLKHDVGVNIKKANLVTTRDALAGAFLLNVVHIPSCTRFYDHNLLHVDRRKRVGYTISENGRERIRKWILEEGRWFGYIETPVFLFDPNNIMETT